jgi:hypothetical protein
MSLQENRRVSLSQLASASGFALSIPLIGGFGVSGAYLGVLSVHLIRTGLLIGQLRHFSRRSTHILSR